MKKTVVITIPAYNEAKTIGKVLSRIKDALKKSKEYNFKILVVDDGSKDDTVKIASKLGARVKRHFVNLGLAQTFRTEMEECLKLNADIIVHIDADNQYNPNDIPRFLKAIEDGYDLVLGSRFKGKIESMPFIKWWGNKAFSYVISKIVKYPISDAQTGFRVFTRKVAENIDLISTYTYTQEQLIKAFRHGFRVIEIPVYFAKRPGKSKLISNPFSYAFKSWVTLFRIYRDYKPLSFFGFIGTTLMLFGFTLGLWLITLFLMNGEINHTPSIILCLLLISTGLQIVLFGFLADMKK